MKNVSRNHPSLIQLEHSKTQAAIHDLAELPQDQIATVAGRYYAMDRDQHWERTQRAFDAILAGKGERAADPIEAVRESYERGITDEFIEPTTVSGRPRLKPGAATTICFTFLPATVRELTMPLAFRSVYLKNFFISALHPEHAPYCKDAQMIAR
jgi:bisphosphoglycerate-independent phosphoglycerate mutase (AlkP superfamily)